MIEAAIFDMDGLLIDSEPFWRRAHIETVSQQGPDIVITEDDVRAMAGKRTDEVVRHWQEKYALEHIPSDKLEAAIVTKVIENINLEGKALDGASKVLDIFRDHDIPVAIASSSVPEVIEAVINKLDIAEYIKLAYSAKYEEFGKPHPGVFLTTARKLGVNALKCLVFEDSMNGILAAKAAKMKVIAVPEKPFRPEDFKEADVVVSSLSNVSWDTIQELLSK